MTIARIFALISLILISPGAWTETVQVKYFGSVDLSQFSCKRTVSSFVNRICYDDQNSIAVVQLKSSYYAYCGVPETIVVSWLSAASKGRFYNQEVKGRYRC